MLLQTARADGGLVAAVVEAVAAVMAEVGVHRQAPEAALVVEAELGDGALLRGVGVEAGALLVRAVVVAARVGDGE